MHVAHAVEQYSVLIKGMILISGIAYDSIGSVGAVIKRDGENKVLASQGCKMFLMLG